MEDVKKIVVVVVSLLSVAAALPEYHRVVVNYGEGKSAVQDVMFDEENQYSVVVLMNVTGKVTPSVNLHDFATGFSAIKDVNSGKCYIKESAHPMRETKKALKEAVMNDGVYEVKEYFKCMSKTPIPNEDLEDDFGKRIAEFCENYTPIFAATVHAKRSRRELYFIEEYSLGCFLCFGC